MSKLTLHGIMQTVCLMSRSSSCVSHVAADNEKIVSQEPSCARKVERPSFELEGPSFDLGF